MQQREGLQGTGEELSGCWVEEYMELQRTSKAEPPFPLEPRPTCISLGVLLWAKCSRMEGWVNIVHLDSPAQNVSDGVSPELRWAEKRGVRVRRTESKDEYVRVIRTQLALINSQ